MCSQNNMCVRKGFIIIAPQRAMSSAKPRLTFAVACLQIVRVLRGMAPFTLIEMTRL